MKKLILLLIPIIIGCTSETPPSDMIDLDKYQACYTGSFGKKSVVAEYRNRKLFIRDINTVKNQLDQSMRRSPQDGIYSVKYDTLEINTNRREIYLKNLVLKINSLNLEHSHHDIDLFETGCQVGLFQNMKVPVNKIMDQDSALNVLRNIGTDIFFLGYSSNAKPIIDTLGFEEICKLRHWNTFHEWPACTSSNRKFLK